MRRQWEQMVGGGGGGGSGSTGTGGVAWKEGVSLKVLNLSSEQQQRQLSTQNVYSEQSRAE